MKYYSGIIPQYGISGPFIYAKSEAIFHKNAYIIITLAPMIDFRSYHCGVVVLPCQEQEFGLL